jgi:fatty acid desaturase
MGTESSPITNGTDRERLLDMERRLRPVGGRAFVVIGLGLLASSPWTGWWTLAPLLVAVALFLPGCRPCR